MIFYHDEVRTDPNLEKSTVTVVLGTLTLELSGRAAEELADGLNRNARTVRQAAWRRDFNLFSRR